tara:strand:- start:187 stop:828 length:642 start_codon:yes stop_codon:yes gene_type:complete
MIPVILGVPRSGTSLCANILTHMGYNFIGNSKTIDPYFPKILNPDGYFQRLDLYYLVCSQMKTDFHKFNVPCQFDQESLNTFQRIYNVMNNQFPNWGLKEPYLIKFLNDISSFDNILFIVVYRNPQDTLASIRKFKTYFPNLHDYNQYDWKNYYSTFLKKKKQLKLNTVFLSYDELLSHPLKTYQTFYEQLSKYKRNLKFLNKECIRNIIKTT